MKLAGASFWALVPAFLACSACSHASPRELTVHEYRQGVLNEIADRCGLSRTTFDLRGDDELHFKPEPTAEYSKVDCGLRMIKKSGIPYKMGFVGNEAFDGNLQ